MIIKPLFMQRFLHQCKFNKSCFLCHFLHNASTITLTPVKADVELIFLHVKTMNLESCLIGAAVLTTTTTTRQRCHLNFVRIEKYS